MGSGINIEKILPDCVIRIKTTSMNFYNDYWTKFKKNNIQTNFKMEIQTIILAI